MSGKKDEDIDDFVFNYSGVKVVHLEHFNKENFRQKALALGWDLINVAKFLRLKLLVFTNRFFFFCENP